MIKMPQKYQMTKKNLQNDQNTHKTTKMIKKNTHGIIKATKILEMTKTTSIP
jgi:hypothetical protein